MGYLETVDVEDDARQRPLRLPVQWVNRPNLDFRGFAGTIVSGTVRKGETIRVLPSGRQSTVARIVTMDGDLDFAVAGQAVTLALADEIDISRGDVIATTDLPGGRSVRSRDCRWRTSMPPAAYWLKVGTARRRRSPSRYWRTSTRWDT
jgi:bifunctional enzyme CysN/CysC